MIEEMVSPSPGRNYWLDLFTAKTWQEFLDAGGEVSGFREGRWKTVQRIEVGDYLLAYLTGISRWIGIIEVVSPAFRDNAPIWESGDYPARLKVRTVVGLTPETAVPVLEMRDRLSVFRNLRDAKRWSGAFRGSPAKWKREDGEAVVAAVLDAEKNPIVRSFDPKRLDQPPAFEAKTIKREVTIPQDAVVSPATVGAVAVVQEPTVETARAHTEIQWLLLKFGSDLGVDVWVASNDRNRDYLGNKFNELPAIRRQLPRQFDDATNRTIELIDVLWLQGNAIVAAFEIESTTSIYSGLLRMADLIAMQPNLTIPLYLVAPDERRAKVMEEVNRPTFSRLSPPLAETCRYIAFSALREKLTEAAPFVHRLRPEFIEDISESCEI